MPYLARKGVDLYAREAMITRRVQICRFKEHMLHPLRDLRAPGRASHRVDNLTPRLERLATLVARPHPVQRAVYLESDYFLRSHA